MSFAEYVISSIDWVAGVAGAARAQLIPPARQLLNSLTATARRGAARFGEQPPADPPNPNQLIFEYHVSPLGELRTYHCETNIPTYNLILRTRSDEQSDGTIVHTIWASYAYSCGNSLVSRCSFQFAVRSAAPSHGERAAIARQVAAVANWREHERSIFERELLWSATKTRVVIFLPVSQPEIFHPIGKPFMVIGGDDLHPIHPCSYSSDDELDYPPGEDLSVESFG